MVSNICLSALPYGPNRFQKWIPKWPFYIYIKCLHVASFGIFLEIIISKTEQDPGSWFQKSVASTVHEIKL